MKSIYRSPESQAAIEAMYDRQVAKLPFPVEDRRVDTRFGRTHLLLAGPKDAPPLVVFHGGNDTNPSTLGWIAPLAREFRIIAPDTIGHPGKSAPVRLPPGGLSYGMWVSDLMEELKLKSAAMMGGSYGAGILLNAMVCIPDRIAKAVLFIPSGFVSMPARVMWGGFILPLIRYTLAPSDRNLELLLGPVFGKYPADPEAVESSRMTFRHVRIEPNMPKNVSRRELEGRRAPVLVLPGEHDLLFPALAVIRRAREVIPNLTAVETIPDTPHYLTPKAREWLCARARRFLIGGG
ncbi:MAG: alpha/beta hydrolase [Anaerolineales bacterium]|nr:alpha/beta hydrolase [Anaerolineales bacterium]